MLKDSSGIQAVDDPLMMFALCHATHYNKTLFTTVVSDLFQHLCFGLHLQLGHKNKVTRGLHNRTGHCGVFRNHNMFS